MRFIICMILWWQLPHQSCMHSLQNIIIHSSLCTVMWLRYCSRACAWHAFSKYLQIKFNIYKGWELANYNVLIQNYVHSWNCSNRASWTSFINYFWFTSINIIATSSYNPWRSIKVYNCMLKITYGWNVYILLLLLLYSAMRKLITFLPYPIFG